MNQPVQVIDPEEVIVLLTLQFRPGTVENVLASVVPSIYPTRAEVGNLDFQVFQSKENSDQVIIFERWQNQEALAAHWQLPYTKEALQLFDEYLAEPFSQTKHVAYLLDVTKQGR